ncbi:hypothetical protein KY290_005259 [Solanum tuberosum]|uniref:Uncharacterized protein n=1 Tax=Solanum tuberosum TaxID=4113 RepID=A0ABQ7WG21_SOLTU|nr:hypothetical protein KY289_005654 [Solanum tuberosum]KAH0778832.1 hypothetical protein KY290_005259 [Solanum tuberosum]
MEITEVKNGQNHSGIKLRMQDRTWSSAQYLSPLFSNMSHSPSSSKKMLDSLNEIDPVAFYTSSDAPSPSKMSTISPVNITESSPLTPQYPIDLNNPAPSHQPGPYSTMLSDYLFEGDLSKSKSFESNILAASENLVIESLAQMREEVMHEEGENFVDEFLGGSQPVFNQTPKVGAYPSSDSTNTDEDNVPLKRSLQRRMVPVSTKGK